MVVVSCNCGKLVHPSGLFVGLLCKQIQKSSTQNSSIFATIKYTWNICVGIYVPQCNNFKIAGDSLFLNFIDTGFLRYVFKVMPAKEICKKQLKVDSS